MRRLYAAGGHTCFTLAARFGITFGTVCRVVKRQVWKHVD